MNMKMCFNWKVLAGLGAIGLAIWVVAPGAATAALPFLFILACPLSMLFMGGMMGQKSAQQGQQTAQQAGAPGGYTCPIHAQVNAVQPGTCPACGMYLVSASSPPRGELPQPSSGVALTREQKLAQLQAQLGALNEEQATLAGQLAEIEASERAALPSGQTMRQAEEVAWAADRR